MPSIALGIRVKLVALMVTMSFLIVGILASYFPARQIAERRADLRDRAVAYGRLASLQLRSAIAFGDQQTAREVLGTIAQDPLVSGAAVYTENGSRLDGEGTLSELAQSARHGFPEPRTFYLPGRVLVTAPVTSMEGPHGTLVMELSTGSVIAARNRLVHAALAVGASALLLGAALAWAIARSLASRVEVIARAAALVANGDLEQHLELRGPRDEIGVLAYGFDAMIRRLRELIAHIHRTAQEENSRLERLVQQRTSELDRKNADLRLVLDNVEQGFVTIDREAHVVGERSRVVDVWLGAPDSASLWDRLEGASVGCGRSFQMAWSQVADGLLPAAVCLDQMPQQLTVGDRHLRFEYKPIGADESFEKLVVVVSDATAVVERARAQQEERDILEVSSRLIRDRKGSLEFFSETQDLIERLSGTDTDPVRFKRDLHTLKGNAAVFGLSTISDLCHEAETELEHGTGRVDCARIANQWESTCSKLRHLQSDQVRAGIEVDETEYTCVLEALRGGVDPAQVERMVAAWRLEPLRARLERAGEQLTATASRLGKGNVEVAVETPRIYLAPEDLLEFWGAFTHVVRNAAAHGVEPADERVRRGKPGVARFVLRAGVAKQRLFVEVEDTGPGIDWDTLRARAIEKGLPCATEADLKNALFADGMSTTQAITEVSGRGVGLSAVRSACERQQGTVEVTSTRGEGTKFRFSWPREGLKNLVEFELGAAT